MKPTSLLPSFCGCRRATRAFLGLVLASLLLAGLAPGNAAAQSSTTISIPPRLSLFGSPSSPSSPDGGSMDTTVFLCSPQEICISLHGEDDDGDMITLSLIQPSSFVTLASSDSVLDTTHCFTPDTAGVYCFVFELDDDQVGIGLLESDDDVDSVCVTVVFNAPPVIACPPNVTIQCGDPTDPSNTGFATADSTCNQPSSCGCTGGIRLLSLRTLLPYAGGVVSIEARGAKSGFLDSSPYGVDTELFDGTLFTSSTFSGAVAITRMELVGTDVEVTYTIDVGLISLLKMSSNSEFRVSSPSVTNQQAIHTSCSQPIAPPFDFGAFSIVGFIDKSGSECSTDSTNCSVPTITFVDDITSPSCPLIITRTWTATDSCGATTSCVQTITVQDTTAPIVSCPPDVSRECNTSIATGSATATDNCDTSPVITSMDVITPGACPGDTTITRTWTATDDCGNSSSCTQTITVRDTTPPVISCPADATIECNSGAATGSATATDNCDVNPAITFSDVVTLGACPGDSTIIRTWTATDTCGNSASCSQTITLHDTTPPPISCPPDVTVNWGDDSSPTGTGSATATDICDPAPTISWVDSTDPGACAGASMIFRTWTATDCSGNSSSCLQKVNVLDLSPPVITCPASVTLECGASSDPSATGSATASDSCDVNPTVTFSDVVSGASCTGDSLITRTWVATDCSANTDTCVQTISIQDSTAPSITCPAIATVECGGPRDPSVTGSATATDNCDPNLNISFSDAVTPGQCPGDTTVTRTWTATDCNGNASSCDQIITVQDTAPPPITCPPTATVECGDSNDPSLTGSATATDVCDPNPAITFSDIASGASCNGDSIITRTWTALDCSGNSSSCNQTINITDSKAPVITCPPNTTIECGASSDPAATGSATATDICDANPSVSFTDVVTGNSCTGDSLITRSWVATDCSGNLDTCTQLISVQDTVGPPLSCPANAMVECGAPRDPGVTGSATATDDCDPDPTITFTDSVSAGQCPGDTLVIRTWVATDCSGNSTSCQQTISVQDTAPPIITCPVNLTIECGDPSDILAAGSATAVDSCDANPSVTFVDVVTGASCSGDSLITRTWTASDCSGNTSTCDQLISITDTTPPTLTCANDTTFECNAIGPNVPVGVTDICDPNPTITSVEDTAFGSCPQSFTITRTTIAQDCSGNVDSCTQVITIQDTQAPVCSLPGNQNLTMCQPAPITLPVSATDNCDASVTCSVTSGPGAIVGANWTWTPPAKDTSVSVTIRCVDDCGNSCEGTFTVTIAMNEAPVLTVANDTLIENCDLNQICLSPFSVTDADNNLKYAICILGADTVSLSGQFCFVPDAFGPQRIICIAEDSCGVIVTDTTVVVVTCNDKTCIVITQTDRADDGSLLPGSQSSTQGDHERVYVVHESGSSAIGGFDFLITYDNSALAFTGATEGNVYADREWEFFTFRFGPNGNCNGGCPSGKLRVLGLANQAGDGHVPLTYTPLAGDTLACLDFLVSNDRTLECQFVPIRFCWLDCGDNVLSDKTGDTLSISCKVFDYQGTGSVGPQGNRAEITNINATFPSIYGAPSACEVSGGPGKPAPSRDVNYKDGGIKIACADSIDARGDLNLNGLANEIADAVLYTKYFINGITSFNLAPQGQIAASDVNADGLPLTVADLVYLIRVIVGDALPVPKLAHNSLSVEFSYEGGVFSSSHDLGAALFVFNGRAEIELLQSQLELSVGYREGQTFALIAPSLENRSIGEYIQVGELIATDAPLLSIEAADYDGAIVETLSKVVLPSEFALHQNYPNPFNPSTKFSFDLPQQTAYTLSVYNVSGQLVAEFDGAGVGAVEVEWNAASVASGMYFYKLTAGKFTSTRKALLLK